MSSHDVHFPPAVRRWTAVVLVWLLQAVAFAVVAGWRAPAPALIVFAVILGLTGTLVYSLFPAGGDGSTDGHSDERASARAIVRRDRAETELRKALYDLRNLFAVSVDLSSVHQVEELCRSLLLHLLGFLRADRAAVLLPEERGDLHFRRRFGRGIDETTLNGLEIDSRAPEFQGATSVGGPLHFEGRNRFESHLMAAGFALLTPLSHSGALEGLLLLGPKISGSAYTEWELQLLSLLANMASVAVANARLYRELEESAITDALTGLFNRGHFDRRLTQEVALARRLGIPLSLVLVDIDHFKSYNDAYGHPAGDALLRRVAEVMKGTSRETDIWARYGGEEFAAILPGVDKSGSRAFAERVRLAVRSLGIVGPDRRKVTVSLGAATFPEDATLVTELIVRADRALYAAKHAGRNRVVLYSEIAH